MHQTCGAARPQHIAAARAGRLATPKALGRCLTCPSPTGERGPGASLPNIYPRNALLKRRREHPQVSPARGGREGDGRAAGRPPRMAHLDSAGGWFGVTDLNGSASPVGYEALPLNGLGATSSSAKRPNRRPTAQWRHLPHLRWVCLASLRAVRPPVLRVARGVLQTVGRGPVLGNEAGHWGPTKRQHDQRRPAGSPRARRFCGPGLRNVAIRPPSDTPTRSGTVPRHGRGCIAKRHRCRHLPRWTLLRRRRVHPAQTAFAGEQAVQHIIGALAATAIHTLRRAEVPDALEA